MRLCLGTENILLDICRRICYNHGREKHAYLRLDIDLQIVQRGMGILSLLPLIGTAIIWLPIGIMLLVEGHVFAGLGILIYSAVLTSNVDNLIRPKIISKKANIHPVLVLIGVFGGLKLFGFVGVVAGPLILALLLVLLKFYHEESWN